MKPGQFMTAGLTVLMGACSQLSGEAQLSPAQQEMLNSSLKVSAAAIETGQPVAAGRLYENLSRTFPTAPEPKLGLGYLALHAGNFSTADALFAEAGELAKTDALKAEALLGAGRASLGREDLAQARTRFLAAAAIADGEAAASSGRVASWVSNGLAVVASLEGDWAQAKERYDTALALASHPMITANLVRMLVESGGLEEAKRLYASHKASYWMAGDGAELAEFIANRTPGKRGIKEP